MAKYDVTYLCGHKGEVQLFGKQEERERKIMWLEERCDCPECQKAAKNAKTEAVMAGWELPELTGSEKQVSWAKDIRAKRVNEILAYAEEAKKHNQTLDLELAKTLIRTASEAKFWIDTREQVFQRVLQKLHSQN